MWRPASRALLGAAATATAAAVFYVAVQRIYVWWRGRRLLEQLAVVAHAEDSVERSSKRFSGRRQSHAALAAASEAAPVPFRQISGPHRRAMRTAPHVDSGPKVSPGHRLLEARAYDATADDESWDEPNIGSSYEHMVGVAGACCSDDELWKDDAFDRSKLGEHSSDRVRWLSLSELFGDAPHRWPDGRRSYLYAYSHHAGELTGAVLTASAPGTVLQGAVGDCYLLSAVWALGLERGASGCRCCSAAWLPPLLPLTERSGDRDSPPLGRGRLRLAPRRRGAARAHRREPRAGGRVRRLLAKPQAKHSQAKPSQTKPNQTSFAGTASPFLCEGAGAWSGSTRTSRASSICTRSLATRRSPTAKERSRRAARGRLAA